MGEEVNTVRRRLEEKGEILGGVHLEASWDEVTECLY
jgi:3-deoxy-D-arabino-heptulosonate 7-phosphate (DAHP) synthase class II